MPPLLELGIARHARVDVCVSVTPIIRDKDNKILCSCLSCLNLALHDTHVLTSVSQSDLSNITLMPQLLELGIARHGID